MFFLFRIASLFLFLLFFLLRIFLSLFLLRFFSLFLHRSVFLNCLFLSFSQIELQSQDTVEQRCGRFDCVLRLDFLLSFFLIFPFFGLFLFLILLQFSGDLSHYELGYLWLIAVKDKQRGLHMLRESPCQLLLKQLSTYNDSKKRRNCESG